MTAASYCCECDAPPGACEHDAARYLDDIAYERDELSGGWKVPEHERARWESGPNPRYLKQAPASPTPVPLGDLLAQLEGVLDLNPRIAERVGFAYERTPLRVSRIVETVVRDATMGKLSNPAGYLYSRLTEGG